MNTLEGFKNRVTNILQAELPATDAIIGDGHRIADQTALGRTLFLDEMGVNSEAAYKRHSIRSDQIMFHAHIGQGSWQATAEALQLLHQSVHAAGFKVDRAGICLDRRMGLPPHSRLNIPAETGPMLDTLDDWRQIGQTVPIQPHMGDFMIGFPAGTRNTVRALQAGVTTIGNLSQFFAHQVPHWTDHVTTTVETVRAISVLAAKRSQGVMLHSYLEDGFGALFCDFATTAGWAYLERYIVEDLLGAKLSHCIGGLTSDPIKRAGWVFALDRIHDGECLGSMIYGDTISFTRNFSTNRAVVAEYLLWDIMAQLVCPTGHAVQPLPVTEACRIPSAEEIIEAQIFGRRVEETARRMVSKVDFSDARQFADTITAAGKTVFTKALDGLKEAGVDTRDPLELLYVLKQLGPEVFENMFGAGRPDANSIRGWRPVVMSDIFEASDRCLQELRPLFADLAKAGTLRGRRLLIASSDVHEHAILILNQILSELGAATTYLGAEKNAAHVAAAASEHKIEGILISTHNGMAHDYAVELKKSLAACKVAVPVIMGGVLNQKFADQPLPLDVTAELKKLGFYPASRLESRLTRLLVENLDSNN